MADDKAPTPQDLVDPIKIKVTIEDIEPKGKVDFSGGSSSVKDVTLDSPDPRFIDDVIYVGATTDIEFTIAEAVFSDFRFTRSITAEELKTPPCDLGKWFDPGGGWGGYWPCCDEFTGTKPSGSSAKTMTVTAMYTSDSLNPSYLFILEWTEGSTTPN